MITPEQEKSFEREGFFVVDSQLRDHELVEIRTEIDRLHDEARAGLVAAGDVRNIEEINSRFFQWQVHVSSQLIAGLLARSCYVDLCRKFIGNDADLFTGLAAVKCAHNGAEFPWHQDSAYAVTEPLESLVTWTAIDGATRDNGCLRVVPESHRNGLRPHTFNDISIATAEVNEAEESATLALEMSPGQVAVFSSLLLHKTGVNRSQGNRRAILFQFHQPNVVLSQTREPIGDQHPVLRAGKPVRVVPRKGVTGVDKHL